MKSRKNLWGAITCGQNLVSKELSGGADRNGFQNGALAHCHGLDDDRANGKSKARSEVTRACGKTRKFLERNEWVLGIRLVTQTGRTPAIFPLWLCRVCRLKAANRLSLSHATSGLADDPFITLVLFRACGVLLKRRSYCGFHRRE